MKEDTLKPKNTKKQTLIVVSIAVIAIAIVAIVSAVIYNYFFKDSIKQEEFNTQMGQILERDKAAAEESVKTAKEIIEKHGLDIYGQYVNVYNELSQNNNDASGETSATTETVTSAMVINENMTITFPDGQKGWWSIEESKEGIVHLGAAKEGAESMEMFMVCDNALIDLGRAVFFGNIPSEDKFESKFTDASGNMTLEFKNDGTVSGEYNEIIEEDGEKYPWTEVYRGTYSKSAPYLDIVLNGSYARYLTFTAQTSDAGKQVSGFAARYYLKVQD